MKLKFAATAVIMGLILCANAAIAADPLYNKLQQRLVNDGFNKEQISKFYDDPQCFFSKGMVIAFFKHDESKLDYKQFESAEDIANCRAYLKAHKVWFDKAEATYGVPREIITAIILVESRLGSHLGKSKAFNVLSTMAALMDEDVREQFYIMAEDDKRLPREQFMNRANKRASWAYKELKALLTYAAKYDLDPFYFKSSYAGAVGFCQFMPSNIIPYGADGDGDGVIDLFTHADAINSVARYLQKNGWGGMNIGLEQQRKAIHRYNHSNYYVDCILAVAGILKNQ